MYKFIIFISIFFGILFLGHLVIYKSQVKFFDIQSVVGRRTLIFFYIFNFLLLFFAMFGIRQTNSVIVNGIYYYAVLWLPILLYLFLFSSVTWIIYAFIKLLKLKITLKFLYLAFIITILFITAYGIYSYKNIVKTEVKISIQDMPQIWKNKKILLITDVHIGNFRDDSFIDNFVKKLNKEEADVIFIAGDLFDGTKLEINKTAAALNRLQAKQQIYFVYGNHETFSHQADVDKIISMTKIKTLNNQLDTLDGVNILGINHTHLHNDTIIDYLEKNFLSKPEYANNPTIFLCHEPMKDTDKLKRLKVDLQLSGHTHAGQFFPINLITKSLFGKMNYGYSDFGEFKHFTSSGLGVWGPAFRLGTKSEYVSIIFN